MVTACNNTVMVFNHKPALVFGKEYVIDKDGFITDDDGRRRNASYFDWLPVPKIDWTKPVQVSVYRGRWQDATAELQSPDSAPWYDENGVSRPYLVLFGIYCYYMNEDGYEEGGCRIRNTPASNGCPDARADAADARADAADARADAADDGLKSRCHSWSVG